MDMLRKLYNDLVTFFVGTFMQWVWPHAIWVKVDDMPVIDPKTGKPVINWWATLAGRALSVITAVWGTYEVLGMTIAEWINKVAIYFGLV